MKSSRKLSFAVGLIATLKILWAGESWAGPHRESGRVPSGPLLVGLPKPESNNGEVFAAGSLGSVDSARKEETALNILNQYIPVGPDSRASSLVVGRIWNDELGKGHVEADQFWRGKRIEGGTVRLHVDWGKAAAESLSGHLSTLEEITDEPGIGWRKALRLGLRELGLSKRKGKGLRRVGKPELTYVVDDFGRAQLAWRIGIRYKKEGDKRYEILYLHAATGRVLAMDSQHSFAKNRLIRNMATATGGGGAPVLSEGGTTTNATAQLAYDHLGMIYDYFFIRHNRDSIRNTGEQIVAAINFGTSYGNAFWDGSRLVLGSGVGGQFANAASSLDVMAHEYSHGVIDFILGLVFAGEPGALNEGLCNVFAASTAILRDGGITPQTWLIGDDYIHPSLGPALYVLDDPQAIAGFRDYYPDRVQPLASNDTTAPYLNSTIASLAFVLLVEGGTHPRGRTPVVVPALGAEAAEKIFMRALQIYMTPTSNFLQTRNATIAAATDLFGASAANAVDLAWKAVGVPPPETPTVPPTPLQSGVPVTGLSSSIAATLYFKIIVPPGSASLAVSTSSGSGDADLYVRQALLPTLSVFDCRSFGSGSNEVCQIANPTPGEWFILLNAYGPYSGVSLAATAQPAAVNVPPTARLDYSYTGKTVSFFDRSTDPDSSIGSRLWTFGDGGTATSVNPVHVYPAAGIFTVQLRATDVIGAETTVSRSINLRAGALCTGCTNFGGQLASGAAESEPNGEQYYAPAGNHVGVLAGPAVTGRTNFDLFLLKFETGQWTVVAQSTGAGSNESITYRGAPGSYLWQVRSVGGSGEYQLGVSHP